MRVCIVMGAGSTYANGLHFRENWKRKTVPPLDYTFFQKISELEIRVPQELRRYAGGLPTGSPFESDRPGRMEEFLRDLFHDFLNSRDQADADAVVAYRQLVEIYAGVLRQTTDWMRGPSYGAGPVGKLIAAAAEVADEVDIITFNHDLVIENEIYRRARLRKRWCITRAYGEFSEGRTPLATAGQPQFPEHDSDCDHDRPIVVHKMHGSLNWYVRIRGSVPTPGVLRGDVSAPDVMITIDRAVREVKQVRMRPATGSRRGRQLWWVWPVIVPPVYGKQALIQSFMPSVWQEARGALEAADRVIFFGYSLPPADIEAEKLFHRALDKNAHLPWVGVIDPSTEAMKRFADIAPGKQIRRYPKADKFFESSQFD